MKEEEKTRVKRSHRSYNLGFKLSVVSQVEKGEMTCKQAEKKLWHTRSQYCIDLVAQTWYLGLELFLKTHHAQIQRDP